MYGSRNLVFVASLGLAALASQGCAASPLPLGRDGGASEVRVADPVPWDGRILSRDPAWYGSAQARAIADSVLLYQSAEGAWPKNVSLATPPAGPIEPGSTNTIDNQATTVPMAYLARVIAAGRPEETAAYRAAFNRGLDWVLAAQYPNGGWPQFYPLRGDYYDRITFNDDAMVDVMSLLDDIHTVQPAYGFVDEGRRARAAQASAKGLDIIIKTQIRRNGVLTVWCAQYDETTLQPAWARRYEPPSFSGGESVGIVRYLMGLPNPSVEVVASIEAAVAWFGSHALTGIRVESFTDAQGQQDRRVVQDASAGPLWARFYDLETGRPLFMGRDSVAKASLAEIEQERRAGYNYYTNLPARLLSVDYPAWRRKIGGTR